MNALWSWFHMGGYAGYVWSAYGLVFTVFIVNARALVWQDKTLRKHLSLWLRGLA